MDKRVRKDMGYVLYRQLVRRFFGELLAYSFAVTVIGFLCYWWCESRIWQPYDSTYLFLHSIKSNLAGVFLFTLLLGCIVISCVHFQRIAKLMQEIVQGVEDLYTERVTYIQLPSALKEVEQTLNEIMLHIRSSRQAARETEQRKNEMIVYMAHDLKTPLTSVLGYLTLLQEEKMISEELREKYIAIAWNKAARLEELINEFFEITRFNYAHLELNKTTVNMSRMIEQILYEFKPQFQEKNITYRLEIDSEVMVSCDVEKMERVYDNLLKNAIHYSYAESELKVMLYGAKEERDKKKTVRQEIEEPGTQRQKETGYQMKLIMENAGKTIPPEKQETIFQQFFRMDSARSSKNGGTGLGLAIARQIVELHGGKVWCESEAERVRFILWI